MRKLNFCTFRITRAQLFRIQQVVQFWLKTFFGHFQTLCTTSSYIAKTWCWQVFFEIIWTTYSWQFIFLVFWRIVFGKFFYDDPGFQMSIIQRIEPVYFKTCMHQSVSNLLEHEKKRLAKFLLIYSRSDPIFGYCYFNRVASGQTK